MGCLPSLRVSFVSYISCLLLTNIAAISCAAFPRSSCESFLYCVRTQPLTFILHSLYFLFLHSGGVPPPGSVCNGHSRAHPAQRCTQRATQRRYCALDSLVVDSSLLRQCYGDHSTRLTLDLISSVISRLCYLHFHPISRSFSVCGGGPARQLLPKQPAQPSYYKHHYGHQGTEHELG